MPEFSRSRICIRNGFIFAVCMAALGFADFAGGLAGINNYFYDLAFRVRGERKPVSSIVVAAIDEKSLAELGRWPIERHYYTELLGRLGQAKAVGIDLIFAEATADDAGLGEMISNHGRVVLPLYIDAGHTVYFPLQKFAAAGTGHSHFDQDIDGVVRRVFHGLADSKTNFPSFSRVLESLLTGEPTAADKENGVFAPVRRLVQTDPHFINYYGGKGAFPYLSIVDILKGKYDEEYFSGKTVVVGATATGLEDGMITPFSQDRNKTPGVEIHATILSNLLEGSAISIAPFWLQWGGTLLFALICLISFWRVQGLPAALLWSAGFFITPVVIFVPFSAANFWLPPATFMGAVSAAFVIGYIYHLEAMAGSLAQARQAWEDSFNAIADGIVVCDEEGGVVEANQAGKRLLAGPLAELCTPENIRKISQPGGESCLLERDGGYYAVSSHSRLSDEGRPCGCVVVVNDITSQTNAEKNQRQLEEQFFQVQKMESIGRLAGGVAHDFNNILTAILGYGEISMMQLSDDHPARENIQVVLDAGNRGAALTRQLLAFSRRDRQEKEIIQPDRIISNMVKMLRRLVGEDVIFKLATDESVHNLEADPGQIEQVIMNLVVNSRDAMPEGGTLLIGAEDRDIDAVAATGLGGISPGLYVVIFVEDSGTGVGPEDLDHIFEPFYTTKVEGKGTGLGLSIVWSVVKQHNGHVSVESTPGKGTRVEVFIPACCKADERTIVGQTDIMYTGKENILVVEDQEQIRKLIAAILSSLGYTVLAVPDAKSAIEESRKQKEGAIDLLLTDVILPGMDGVGLGRKISETHPMVKILYMSGYPQETIARYGVLNPESAFVQKPLTPTRLASVVRKVLDSRPDVKLS